MNKYQWMQGRTFFAVLCLGFTLASGEVEIRQCLVLSESSRQKLALTVVSNPEAAALWKKIKEEVQPFLGDAPRPLAVINYEGLLDTDSRRIQTESHLEDMDKLSLMTWAYSAHPSPEYGEAIRKFVWAWASTFKPTGNPINENKLESVILGYSLVKTLFTSTERTKVEAWMHDIAQKERSGLSNNNWESKRLKLVGVIGLVLGNKSHEDFARERFRTYIQAALRPNGSSVDFEERDALGYHTSGLDPLLVFALMAKQFHPDAAAADLYRYQSPSGASLMKSVHFVDPYAKGEKKHEEFANSKVQLDKDRRAAGIEKYQAGTYFKPVDAVEMYALSVGFEPSYSGLIADILKSQARQYPTWMTLMAAIPFAPTVGLLEPVRKARKAELREGMVRKYATTPTILFEDKFDLRGRDLFYPQAGTHSYIHLSN